MVGSSSCPFPGNCRLPHPFTCSRTFRIRRSPHQTGRLRISKRTRGASQPRVSACHILTRQITALSAQPLQTLTRARYLVRTCVRVRAARCSRRRDSGLGFRAGVHVSRRASRPTRRTAQICGNALLAWRGPLAKRFRGAIPGDIAMRRALHVYAARNHRAR